MRRKARKSGALKTAGPRLPMLAARLAREAGFVRGRHGEPDQKSLGGSKPPRGNHSHLPTAAYALPLYPQPLIGRQVEIGGISELLLKDEIRLVTLTGSPGVGKTRLGVEIAQGLRAHFDHGVCFVDLAPMTDGRLLIPAIARRLGIREIGPSVLDQLSRALRNRKLLLVLDNFEHLVSAAGDVAELVSRCPRMKVLVTSRVPLHLTNEREFHILPFVVPDPKRYHLLKEIALNPAVALFLTRARNALPDSSLGRNDARIVADICARLDGLPLAIELAAARVGVLSIKSIQALLAREVGAERLKFLAARHVDLPMRHSTLLKAFEWSYDLLPADHQGLFRNMGIFQGGCALDAVQAVCGSGPEFDVLEGLTVLVDHSLLFREIQPDGLPRFRMLQTIREFARDRLDAAGEVSAVKERHARHYLALAEEAAPHLWGPASAEWSDRLELDLDNILAALDWSLSDSSDHEIALRLGGALFRFWDMRGHVSEGRHWLERLLAALPQPTIQRARMLLASSYVAFMQGDYPAAWRPLDEMLDVARQLADTWGIAFALVTIGLNKYAQGDVVGGLTALEEALVFSREVGQRTPAAAALAFLAQIAISRGEYPRAERFNTEALHLYDDLGDYGMKLVPLIDAGWIALLQGQLERAVDAFSESLLQALTYRHGLDISAALDGLAGVMTARGELKRAVRLLGASAALREGTGQELLPVWRNQHETLAKDLRAKLGEKTFAAGWLSGEALSGEKAIEEVLAELPSTRSTRERSSAPDSRYSPLSPREQEVAELVARGLSNREIARSLIISERTAENHIQHILNKLSISSRFQIATWVRDHTNMTSS